jgi:16S rRNA (adenine1518-N6/adenine1519-N6)-dimethyltransferase
MAQTKHHIQALLAGANMRPRYRFGQNFMIDGNLVRLVADAGKIVAGDWVIEVGPGTGTLTEEILSRGGQVLAVEIDRDLASLLRERFGAREDFRLVVGDALATKHALNRELAEAIRAAKLKGRTARLVANLPYNIASPLIIELLIAGVDLLAFTVQKEVAERLKAAAGDEAYGTLSIIAQFLSDVEILRTLPPQAFWPAPKIESSLVRLTRRDRLGDSAAAFGTFVRAIFSSRRKTLRKAILQAGLNAEKMLEATGIDPQKRPEEISPDEFLALFQASKANAG